MSIQHKLFFNIAHDTDEYAQNIVPIVSQLRRERVDVFSFLERSWCGFKLASHYVKSKDNIAFCHLSTYENWLDVVGKKTRNMIRKAERNRVTVKVEVWNEGLALGIWKIYNETPIRQGRKFPHYGMSLETVRQMGTINAVYITAYFENELVGFAQVIFGDCIAIISQILSLIKHWDKAVNNALIAKTVEHCARLHQEWLMYGRIGNHPSLDLFKLNNGFRRFELNRCYISLSTKGRIAIALRLHRELKDMIPRLLKIPLFPVYNWVSRRQLKL